MSKLSRLISHEFNSPCILFYNLFGFIIKNQVFLFFFNLSLKVSVFGSKGLDFAISEAKKHGIKLILSLVNNYDNFGGRKQYVDWARSQGQSITSEDDFYTNSVVKDFYRNHIKVNQNQILSLTHDHEYFF